MRFTVWSSRIAAPGCLALALAGCGDSNPGEYHSIKQVQSTTRVSNGGSPETTAESSPIVSDSKSDVIDDVPVSALAPMNVVDGASVANLLKVVPNESAVASNAIQPASATTASTGDKPHTYELLVPDKSFQRDTSSKALRVSYDDLDLLKVINLEPVTENAAELMPGWLKELSGQRIRIRGFMYPTFEAEGIERFVLARDNQICCFGRDPKVYDLVQVDMRHGKTTNYIPATRAFDVIGKFKIDMVCVDGKPFGLYYIEDAEIIDR